MYVRALLVAPASIQTHLDVINALPGVKAATLSWKTLITKSTSASGHSSCSASEPACALPVRGTRLFCPKFLSSQWLLSVAHPSVPSCISDKNPDPRHHPRLPTLPGGVPVEDLQGWRGKTRPSSPCSGEPRPSHASTPRRCRAAESGHSVLHHLFIRDFSTSRLKAPPQVPRFKAPGPLLEPRNSSPAQQLLQRPPCQRQGPFSEC